MESAIAIIKLRGKTPGNETHRTMTAKEHDTQLLWQAYNAGYDFGKIQECEDACKTESIKAKIHEMKMKRYHIEELKAEMI